MNRLLASRPVERPWGREQLPAPFVAPAGTRIGEIWFETPAEIEQLLVKYIFTSQALSVQVHPSDAQALGGRGKEECWLVTSPTTKIQRPTVLSWAFSFVPPA